MTTGVTLGLGSHAREHRAVIVMAAASQLLRLGRVGAPVNEHCLHKHSEFLKHHDLRR